MLRYWTCSASCGSEQGRSDSKWNREQSLNKCSHRLLLLLLLLLTLIGMTLGISNYDARLDVRPPYVSFLVFREWHAPVPPRLSILSP